MRVTMKHTISGTRNGVSWPAPGELIDLPDAEALQLIATGAAVAADSPAPAPVVVEATEVADAVPEGEKAVAVPAKPAKRVAKKRT